MENVAAGGEATRKLLVRQVRLEAEQVVSIELVDPHGAPLPHWEPGAHLDIVLASGLIRQYSICGGPADRSSYRIAVLREEISRGGSKEIHESALVGRCFSFRGPRNHFELVDADRYLFIAGGIGIAPILPMVLDASVHERHWKLVYVGRRRAGMAFLEDVSQIAGGEVDVVARDEADRPDLASALAACTPGTLVYCCGPAGMLASVEEHCARLLGPDALHVERFTAPPAGPDATEAPAEDFEVELARTGVVLSVPANRSLLRVVLDAVPSHLYSCEEGYCGTCEARVLDGEPDHRDTVLTDEERADQKMILCVGRSRSPRLVLDL